MDKILTGAAAAIAFEPPKRGTPLMSVLSKKARRFQCRNATKMRSKTETEIFLLTLFSGRVYMDVINHARYQRGLSWRMRARPNQT